MGAAGQRRGGRVRSPQSGLLAPAPSRMTVGLRRSGAIWRQKNRRSYRQRGSPRAAGTILIVSSEAGAPSTEAAAAFALLS